MIKTIKSIILEKTITSGVMLDLGCGKGQDSVAAAEAGFIVTAVDKDAIIDTPENSKISKVQSLIENFVIEENKYDLIYADNSLPFTTKENVQKIIIDAANKVRIGGVVYFSLFGIKDEWFGNDKMNFWTRDEANDFVSKLPMKLYKRVEEEGYAPKMNGEIKYWHVFRFTFKK